MSAAIQTPPYDPLGLEAPFAQGEDQMERAEAAPAWQELGESPYAEATETIGAYEDPEHMGSAGEELAWLDVEAEDAGAQTFAEDDRAREWQHDTAAGEADYLDEEQDAYALEASFAASPGGQSVLQRATVGGFGRYRSDVASLAPSERAKIAALAKYVLWSFGPGRTPVRSIELVGHADRDAARGAAFETTRSRNRALQMRAILAEAIDRQSAAHQSADPPWPPFSARLHWKVLARGARQLLVANPRTEAERARNRRVDIALRATDTAPVQGLAFEAEDEDASIQWTFPVMLRFSKAVPAAINATNCCRAVQTARRLFEAANPPKSPCGSFNFFGSQLITARDYQAPLSAKRKCCQWSDAYWRQCRAEPYHSSCAHCGDVPGPHLVLKYAKDELNNAVARIKQALDQGCTVAAGVLSGICDDKPDVGCARVAKADAWRQCPEHWVLILAYQGDSFLFWDSSQASAMQTRDRHHFGLLDYDRETPRLSTARSTAGADGMVVDASGFHTRGYPSAISQKRFQVLELRNTAPCPAWEANTACGEYTDDGRFAPRSCPLPDTLREDEVENFDMPETEFFDDEERDASESPGQDSQQEWFESEQEAFEAAPALAQLPAQQRQWVLALDRSALERLPDPAQRTRFLQQDWSDIEFPGNVPRGQSVTAGIKRNWALARELFGAMAGVVPERRVPRTVRFRERPVRPVPGQPGQQLFGEACEAFVRMRQAARQDGVELFILSSWRSRARQAAASAKQPNPNAVARKASAHMYGLAIDLRMAVAGLPLKEINTRVDRATAAKVGTAAKMGNLVRMYRSPVYKWMALRAREFGWYPYRNEPWHWEYNPPGLKERFESGAGREFEQAADPGEALDAGAASEEYIDEDALHAEQEETPAPPLLRSFTARALGVNVAVLVTQAARTARQVEMLVFAHGLDLCRPVRKNRPASFVTDPPFHLGRLVEASGRPIVLVVPFLDWERLEANGMAFGRKWHRLAQPAVFNQVAAEALEQVRTLTGGASPPAVQRLILAGHSRAYGFFDALAHANDSPHMRSGALGRPLHVWALDTSYSAPIADWRAWLQSRDDLRATLVYRHGSYRPRGASAERELTTGIRGRQFGELAARSGGRLTVVPVSAGKVAHCAIPNAYLPRLLAALPPLTTGEREAEAEESGHEEGEDLAGLEAEAQALATDGEPAGTWAEGLPGEAEGASGRFDAFGDERDAEWSSESSEELHMRDHVDGQEQPLSFEYEEGETGLAGSGLTPAEQRAVLITSLFETGRRGGFYGLSGNFDGQGLSFGLVNWTIGTGSLQPLLRDFAREEPARWAQVFGADASRFLQLISRKGEGARKAQLRFAVEQMNTVSTGAHGRRIWTVRQPWVGYFRRLAEDRAFQQIQLRYVRDLLGAAAGYCRRFRFTSEQAFCFMFDAVASHGKWWLEKKFGRVQKRKELLKQALAALAARFGARVPESEALLAIADVLATTSAQRWADKVRRRKRWFVTGQHPRERELQGLRPRANVPYATSGAGAGEQDSLSPEHFKWPWEDDVEKPYSGGGGSFGGGGSTDSYAESCESSPYPACQGECEAGKKCVAMDQWPTCACWSTAGQNEADIGDV